MRMQNMVVISVGGSLIAPDGVDTAFLKSFKELIERQVEQGFRFLIITGGGATTRKYQQALREVGDQNAEDLDWLGIHVTRLNGQLVRSVFRDIAYPTLITNPEKLEKTDKPLIIAAGWRPGRSTDYVATVLAGQIGAERLVNLSNIDHVYTADPKKDPGATPIEKISWPEFRKLLPPTWDPGLHSPFDPVASAEAEKLGLEVAMINGGKLAEFEKYLKGEPFIGTTIK